MTSEGQPLDQHHQQHHEPAPARSSAGGQQPDEQQQQQQQRQQQPDQQQQAMNPSIQGTIHEDDEDTTNYDANKQRQIELEEEKKLKAKHPCIQRPGSEFLQKRLQRGQKYFDSGDYNMAKASSNSSVKLPDNATPAIDSKILNKRH